MGRVRYLHFRQGLAHSRPMVALLDFETALARLRAAIPAPVISMVPPHDAQGMRLARDLTARMASPRCDVSAMDGYAVRDADCPGPFRVTGVSQAGGVVQGVLGQGEAMRIYTGAAVPAGADRVLVQEITRIDGDRLTLIDEYGDKRHIRAEGSDFDAGATLLRAGTVLGARQLVAAAAADRAELAVWRQPRVALLATGDELATPGSALETPGALPESVSIGVAAMARDWGGEVVDMRRSHDAAEAIATAAKELLTQADVLVVTGGASVGDRDFAKAALGDGGAGFEMVFSKLAIRPGKPVWCARNGHGQFVVGLPGNPTSAMVTARLFLAPLVHTLGGGEFGDALDWRERELAAPLPPTSPRDHFARARLIDGKAEPISNDQSGAQAPLAGADLILHQPGGSAGIAQGERIRALNF